MNNQLKEFLAAYTTEVRSTALKLRELVLNTLPKVEEKIYPGWKVIGYGFSSKMADQILGIAPFKTAVNIYFARGTILPDPKGLLGGSGKMGRHVKVFNDKEIDTPALKSLIKAAAMTVKNMTQLKGEPIMKMSSEKRSAAGVSDEAVKTKTGKTWAQWFSILDKVGAKTMRHTEIAEYLYTKQKCPAWWNQMVAVSYERERGMRAKYQTPIGYQSSVSKTIAVPVQELFKAWEDGNIRRRWLPKAPMTIRKSTPNKSIRVAWDGDVSNMDIRFYNKGSDKSQIVVDQVRLASDKDVEKMKKYWGEKLETLKSLLEK
ncbi:MAG: DUF1801 domain-containing protein [Ignavibacteria bacterium]|nr:DUF1801 domain-containing protein [Ignavibacteria bacterium]